MNGHGMDRQYAVLVFFIPSLLEQPWSSNIWPRVAEMISPWCAERRGRIGVRGTAMQKVAGSAFYKAKGLGKLSFSAKSFEKWNDLEARSRGEEKFASLEIWNPHWEACFSGHPPPDFFFGMHRLDNDPCRPVQSCLIIGLPRDLETGKEGVSIDALAKILNCNIMLSQERPWAVALGGGFTQSIQDIYGEIRPLVSKASSLDDVVHNAEAKNWTVIRFA